MLQKILHQYGIKRRIKTNIILKLLESRSPDLILDAGCGAGHFLFLVDSEIIGIDLNRKYVSMAKTSKKAVLLADIRYQPFKDNIFDKIICSEVLEHISDDVMAANEIQRTLKKGGIAIITVPFKYPTLPLHFLWLLAGLKDQAIGHVRKGYTQEELVRLFPSFRLLQFSFYGKFFSDLIELLINVIRIKKSGRFELFEDNILHSRAFFFYRLLHPILFFIALIDQFLPITGHNMVVKFAKNSMFHKRCH